MFMRRIRRRFVFLPMAAILFQWSAVEGATAQNYRFQSGADLLTSCADPADASKITPQERERLLICGSYIQGFLANYSLARDSVSNPIFCLPEQGVSPEQSRRLLIELIRQKPQIRDLPANLNMATSLAWGFPCTGVKSARKN